METGEHKMKTQTYEYTPCLLLQTDVDDECWVYGLVLKKTTKRYLAYNGASKTTKFYKHIKFDEVSNYKGDWEQMIKEAKENN